MGTLTPETQMLRKGKVKEMLRDRRVCVMLRLGKGMIKVALSKIFDLWFELRERFPFSPPVQWR